MLDPADLSLRQLIDWLLTPARSGVYLSVDDLCRLGEEVGLSIAAMNRQLAAEQLFRTAALDGAVDQLFDALKMEFRAHRGQYQALDSPAMEPWLERIDQAAATLDALSVAWRSHDQQVSSAQGDSPAGSA